jgi:hypothetical protein
MHRHDPSRSQLGHGFQNPLRVRGVRRRRIQRRAASPGDGISRRADDVGFGHRRTRLHLQEQVRAQQRAFGFFVHQPGIPGVWHVGRRQEPEAVPAGPDDLLMLQRPRGAQSEIIDADHGADPTAG